MAGVAVSGVMWAIFQNNAGGAWDNAKKSFEAGVEIDGVMTFKGSDAHKAAVTGDTVGDPFKDTSGPSMNILIKLTCLVGLVIAPILGEVWGNNAHGDGHASARMECAVPAGMECDWESGTCKPKGETSSFSGCCSGMASAGSDKQKSVEKEEETKVLLSDNDASNEH